jgi:mono/diheme cytochrome c family protein
MSDPLRSRQLTPASNFDVIKNGRIEKLMPPWGNRLSDAQIWDLTAYVWSLGALAESLTAGEAIYAKKCAACHGSGGAADGPQASANMVSLADPKVMVQRSQVTLLANYQASSHHAALNALPEAELNQALDYIRTFTFKVPQRNGVLKGQVLNATTNRPQGQVSVILRAFEGNALLETITGQADESGNFTFEKLLTDHAVVYMVEGRYRDVPYFSSEPSVFAPDQTTTTLNLNVYETTTNPEQVTVSELHYLLSFSPEAVNVVQIFVFSNQGDKTYIGQSGQTFSFALPQHAQSVAFQNDEGGQRFAQNGRNYNDTAPVPPGQQSQSIVATYNLPYEESLTIKVPLPADIAKANVLIQDQGAQLTSEQLQFVEKREFQGDSFYIFNGSNLKKGGELSLQLSNLDNLSFALDQTTPTTMVIESNLNQAWLRWLVIGLGGLVILGVALGYPYFRPQLTHQPNPAVVDSSLRRQKLLVMLARLDELFESGELDKQLYHRARAKYKTELVELMEQG